MTHINFQDLILTALSDRQEAIEKTLQWAMGFEAGKENGLEFINGVPKVMKYTSVNSSGRLYAKVDLVLTDNYGDPAYYKAGQFIPEDLHGTPSEKNVKHRILVEGSEKLSSLLIEANKFSRGVIQLGKSWTDQETNKIVSYLYFEEIHKFPEFNRPFLKFLQENFEIQKSKRVYKPSIAMEEGRQELELTLLKFYIGPSMYGRNNIKVTGLFKCGESIISGNPIKFCGPEDIGKTFKIVATVKVKNGRNYYTYPRVIC